jgi:hypothetical protein
MALLDLYLSNLTGAPDKPKKKVNEYERSLVRKQATAKLPGGSKSLAEASKEYGKELGINPNMLASSSLVEGVGILFDPKRQDFGSDAYGVAVERGNVDVNKFPIDGFYYAGLDNWGPVVDRLTKKGYLPKDFQYQSYPAWNESIDRAIKSNITDKNLIYKAYKGKGKERYEAIDKINSMLAKKGIQPNQTVAFKNPEDMVRAKAAYLKDLADQVDEYASNKKITLTDEDRDYLIMSGYNGGMGTARGLMNDIAAGKKNVRETGGKNRAAHTHVKKRVDYMGYLGDIFAPPAPLPGNGSLQKATGQ